MTSENYDKNGITTTNNNSSNIIIIIIIIIIKIIIIIIMSKLEVIQNVNCCLMTGFVSNINAKFLTVPNNLIFSIMSSMLNTNDANVA